MPSGPRRSWSVRAAGWRPWPRRRCRSSAWRRAGMVAAVTAPISDGELGERLAARTLELVDIPSESRDEARLAAHVAGRAARRRRARARPRRHLRARRARAGASACCSRATSTPSRRRTTGPGRRDGERVHGLGASDMKGALAVMIELARWRPARGRVDSALFFGREELPAADSALDAAARARAAAHGRPRGRDGADRQRDPRRLPGQHQRDAGRSTGARGHSARPVGRPTTRSTRAAAGSPRSPRSQPEERRVRRADVLRGRLA